MFELLVSDMTAKVASKKYRCKKKYSFYKLITFKIVNTTFTYSKSSINGSILYANYLINKLMFKHLKIYFSIFYF
jgi:hypothetical protein